MRAEIDPVAQSEMPKLKRLKDRRMRMHMVSSQKLNLSRERRNR
jgi:hypothetical protein